MRVVAGEEGGRKLVAPAGQATRPTSERVREATFNSLESHGLLEGAAVVDLFAGSGAMGIEALSRGAATATFVEQDRSALEALRLNLERLGYGDRARVEPVDVQRWLAAGPGPFDLAICDPPYAYAGWPELLASLPAAVAVLESDHAPALGDGWEVAREKRYGSTVVVIARRTQAPETPT